MMKYGDVSLTDGCHDPPLWIVSVPLNVVELNSFSRGDSLAENAGDKDDEEDFIETAPRSHWHFAADNYIETIFWEIK